VSNKTEWIVRRSYKKVDNQVLKDMNLVGRDLAHMELPWVDVTSEAFAVNHELASFRARTIASRLDPQKVSNDFDRMCAVKDEKVEVIERETESDEYTTTTTDTILETYP